MTNQSIWPTDFAVVPDTDLSPIGILVLAGAYESGKTIFALSVDPVAANSEEDTRTLIFDMEHGSVAHAMNFKVDRINVWELMSEKYGDGWQQTALHELWPFWRDLALEKAQSGRYSNIIVDTAKLLQAAAHAYVLKNLRMYNLYSDNQGGLIWGVVKERIIAPAMNALVTHVDTLTLVFHLRGIYDKKKNAPTDRMEIEGLATWKQYASLVLWLYRTERGTVEINTQQYSASPHYPIPSAVVMKSRLDFVNFSELSEDGDPVVTPLLPRRILKATPGAIRKMMSNPQEYDAAENQAPDDMPGVETQEDKDTRKGEEKTKDDLIKRRDAITDKLIEDGYYPDRTAINIQVAVLELLEDARDLTKLDEVEVKLRIAAKPEPTPKKKRKAKVDK